MPRLGSKDHVRAMSHSRWRLVRAVGFLALGASTSVLACSGTETETVPGDPCKGGVIVGDQCYPTCDPARCLDGNVCVGHECKLVCTSHLDCDYPNQACQPVPEGVEIDGDPFLVNLTAMFGVCTTVRQTMPAGWESFCPNGDECTAVACPNGLECDPEACTDGGVPHPEWCQRDPVACSCTGVDDTGALACTGDEPCNVGTCQVPDEPDHPLTGTPCTVSTCDPSECTPFTCNGAGVGDGAAYCTHDCAQDTDCPAGYYCGVIRDPHEICGTDKGTWSGCGETAEPCIDPADFNEDGKQYFEGAYCLLRQVCLRRESCAGCQGTLDCSLRRDATCIDFEGDGALECARFCKGHQDCPYGQMCSPSFPTCEYSSTIPCGTPADPSDACPHYPCVDGSCLNLDGTSGAACSSSADCPAQACVERTMCMPRFGSCRGTGEFCEPCIDDTDCGGPDSQSVCVEFSELEHFCFDLATSTCPGGQDSECPTSPSGASGTCIDDAWVDPSNALYLHCYPPYSNQLGTFTCWPTAL